jgi:hypothetical protein
MFKVVRRDRVMEMKTNKQTNKQTNERKEKERDYTGDEQTTRPTHNLAIFMFVYQESGSSSIFICQTDNKKDIRQTPHTHNIVVVQ